jgi:hypothetical protein
MSTPPNNQSNPESGEKAEESRGGGFFSRLKNKATGGGTSSSSNSEDKEGRKKGGGAGTQWSTLKNDEGKEYYHNATTNETTWEKPEELMSLAERVQHKAGNAAKLASEAAQDLGGKAYDAAEDLGEDLANTSVGQKAASTAQKVVNSEVAKQVKQTAHSAKNDAKMKMNAAKEKMRRIIIEKAVVVAGKGIDNAVDGVATSMGKDPYMPRIIIEAVDSVVDDIRDDAKIFVRENIEDMFEKHDKVTKAKITATYAPCCKRIVTVSESEYDPNKNTYKCNPWYWLRATILYTMTPNDRSFWWQVWQPMFWLLTIISIFPSYGISQIWWVFLFFLRDFRDEYQLVSFMVKVKTTAVLAVGIIPSYMGISTYLMCVEKGTCRQSGPGVQGGFVFSTVFLVLQASLVYIAAIMVPYSKDKGRRVKRTTMTEQTTAKGDERGQRRLMLWLIYDFLTVALCGALFVLAWLHSPSGPSKDLQSKFPKEMELPIINGSLTTPSAEEFTIAQKEFLRGSTGHDLFRARVFWIRVLYGLLCFPWWILKMPMMFPIILHAHPTAYNRLGQTVPFANAKEKGFYGHRCCKCSDDSEEISRLQDEFFKKSKNEKEKDKQAKNGGDTNVEMISNPSQKGL